jgi:hypothetical protein
MFDANFNTSLQNPQKPNKIEIFDFLKTLHEAKNNFKFHR